MLKVDPITLSETAWAVTWTADTTTNKDDVATSLALSPADDYIYVTGLTVTDTGGIATNCFLLKYDTISGTLIWAKAWGDNTNGCLEGGSTVAVDLSGYIYVAGCTSGFNIQAQSKSDFFLLKYHPNGTLLWDKVWGLDTEANDEFGCGLAVSGSTIYMSGMAILSGTAAAVLLKYNSAGILLEEKVWNGEESEFIYSLVVKGGNLYLAGSIYADPWPEDYTDTCSWQFVAGLEGTPDGGLGDIVSITGTLTTPLVDVSADATRTETSPAGVQTGGGVDDFLLMRIDK